MHQLDGPSMRGKCLTPRARSGKYSQDYFHPILASFMVCSPSSSPPFAIPLGSRGSFPKERAKHWWHRDRAGHGALGLEVLGEQTAPK